MRIAETVTFGGSGLDRAAALRRDPVALSQALARGRVLAIWRGKPLMRGDAPGWLEPGHPALERGGPPVFLGLDEGVPRFAVDTSDWSPEAGAEAVAAGFFDPSVQRHPALDESYGFAELRGVMTRLSPRDAELVAMAKAVLHWHRSHGFCAVCGAASDMSHGGWQRTCPACGAHHFPRTDPVVIMLVTRGNSVLLGRSPAWPEGMYSLLAGFVEPGETLEAAVHREVLEEAGIRCGAVGYLASQPWPFPASLMIGARAEALSEEIVIDPEELEQALWVTREEMVTVMAGAHPTIKPARNGAIAHFILVNWLADRLD
ncbi:NAD(+) diphosphatase [Tabrizicola sp.]|uniref:NAD(+) diphosphatase n=1 Tax=Tabrizicola sp. TaxID=2005166 RepID=UPI003F35CFAE